MSPHSESVAFQAEPPAPAAGRFGIRTKLFLAFSGFAALTLIASAVAWLVFGTVERSVSRVTGQSMPGMVNALDLAKIVADIAATAPALVASTSADELTATRATLESDLARFGEITQRLQDAGNEVDIVETGRQLVAKLDALADRVEDRLELQRQRLELSGSAQAAHQNFIETIEPLVDDAVFDLVTSGERVMADNTTATTGLVDDGVGEIDRLLSIQAAINLAAGLLGEAINVADPTLLEPIRERFVSASFAVGRDLAALADSEAVTALGRAGAALLAIGEGPESPLDQRPATAAATARLTSAVRARQEEVLLLLVPMIDDAAFSLVMTTADLTARSEQAIAGLIDGNADILSLMLTAQGDGNLVASLLGDAAAARTDALLGPLEERFTAVDARLQSLLGRTATATFHDDLAAATEALLAFGKGDGGIFALRRGELARTGDALDALAASRTLATQLGYQVAIIVDNAATASQLASDSSAQAIDQAQLALVLITLLGLAGAALVMFRYVDPRIIKPVGRITGAMTQLAGGDTTVDIPGRDRKDELGDMARALGVFRDTAIAVQEANLKELAATRQRLADAIESISEGFSLYDADDRLVVSNRRYQQLLYPELLGKIVPGVTFESLIRQVVADGFVVDAADDPEAWIAARLERRRNPGPPTIQRRSNGRYIMVSERKTADGGTVAVYSDITELKQREAELAQKSDELEQLAGQLAKYLSPQVYESIFTGRQEVKLASERKKLTVFFSDIVGFTSISEKLQPEELTTLLNEFLTEMAKIALSYGATIDKYVGDGILIFFGDPQSHGVKQDALCCVNMAIAMRDKMQELQQTWRDRGIEDPVEIRIGINTGYCTVGNFGSEARMDYTIIGAGVNLAARVQTAAEHGGILITYETYAQVKDHVHCEPQAPITAKGISRPVATYRVIDTFERLGRQSTVLRGQQPHLHFEMDAGAMSTAERETAEAMLREALAKLAKPEGSA